MKTLNTILSTILYVLLPALAHAQEHWGADVQAGAVQAITLADETATGTKPFARIDVWADLSKWTYGPKLDVTLVLTSQSDLDLASPGTVSSLEASAAVSQGFGPSLWFSLYGELGGTALIGQKEAPVYGGFGLQFASADHKARLRIGYSRDERLTGAGEHVIGASGFVALKDFGQIALTLGGDWLRTVWREFFTPAVSQVRIWTAASWGKPRSP